MTLLALVSLAAAAPCPALDAELERATLALVAGDAATADAALADAAASLACAPATSAQLGHLWLVTGATRHLAGQDAAPWLAAARGLAPDAFDARLGPDLRAAFDAAAPPGAATLALEPGLPAFLDGAATTAWPASLDAGPHAVQVLGADGAVRFGREVTLLAGEDALVPTGLPPEFVASTATLPLPGAPVEPEKKRSPALLVASAVALAGGGACAALALAQDDAMETAPDVPALEGAFGRQKAFAYGAYGLWGAAGVGATLYFVLP